MGGRSLEPSGAARPALGRRRALLGAAVALAALAGVALWIRPRWRAERSGGEREEGARFADVASARGITRENVSGTLERYYIFENIGSGCAFLDFDGDGRLDVFASNAGGVETAGASPRRVRLLPGPGAFLYRQREDGRFEDATAAAGLDFRGWGTGVAAGDIEGDGDLDLFLGVFGPDRLYANQGDGSFRERSHEAGVDDPAMASSAVFLDDDRDGDLDLYVANYVEFDLEDPPHGGEPCIQRGVALSCSPVMHLPARDVLYRNRGDGTFEERTEAAGLGEQPGAYGLGVAAADVDLDGWPDIYVANDTTANFLWRNQGDGTFVEEAMLRGIALSETGQGQSGMGVDIADATGDGLPDIVVTNYSEEPNAFYENLGDGFFAERAAPRGLARDSYLLLGWGVRIFDLDLDGRQDLVIANGHVYPQAPRLSPPLEFRQPMLLYQGQGGGKFTRLEPAAAGVLAVPRSHRGLALGDMDRDGDLDILVTLLDGPPLLLENRAPRRGHPIAFVLAGRGSNREALGARIEVAAAGQVQVRVVTRGGSYQSASDAAVHFGLGDAERAERVRILWPAGGETVLGPLEAGRLYEVREEDGAVREVRRFRVRR